MSTESGKVEPLFRFGSSHPSLLPGQLGASHRTPEFSSLTAQGVKFIYGSINTGTLAQLAPDRWLKPHRTDGFAASEYSIPIPKFLIHFTWSLTRGVSEYFSDYSTLSAHGLNPPVGHVAPMRGYGALNSC